MRVKRGIIGNRRRKAILKHTKGYRGGRKNLKRRAHEALMHSWSYAYRDRRKKKSEFRKLWHVRIGAGARLNDISYSRLINALKKANIQLDKKILADLALNNPETFSEIVKQAK